jgi:RimJ/RimL family protein N-acetyltransferase
MPTLASTKTSSGTAALRDLTPEDIPAIADYWLLSPDEFLNAMGIDRARLGSREDIHRRFSSAIRTGSAAHASLALAITLDERFIGYTLLNQYSTEVNYSHWHIIEARLRGCGISTALYPHRIKAYFDLTPISRLIHQTRTRNVGVNLMLDKFVPVAETKYIENPDGVALPGEFHIRYVTRDGIPKLFLRSSQLS